MLCTICGREKHSGHFTQRVMRTIKSRGRTVTNERSGRVPICDDCSWAGSSLDTVEIAKEVVKLIDVDVDVDCYATADLKVI